MNSDLALQDLGSQSASVVQDFADSNSNVARFTTRKQRLHPVFDAVERLKSSFGDKIDVSLSPTNIQGWVVLHAGPKEYLVSVSDVSERVLRHGKSEVGPYSITREPVTKEEIYGTPNPLETNMQTDYNLTLANLQHKIGNIIIMNNQHLDASRILFCVRGKTQESEPSQVPSI